MSEQTIQDSLFSNDVSILDKYTCLSLGATTINDLMKSGKLKQGKRQVICWIENHFKKIDNYIEN